MEVLTILEEKIKTLLALIHDLREKNELLRANNNKVYTENEELRTENAKFAEDNAQLNTQLKLLHTSIMHESEQIDVLNSEKVLTKSVVDDLIKSIDSLVEQESQQ